MRTNKFVVLDMLMRLGGEVVATWKGDDAAGSAEGTVATVPFKMSWKPSAWRGEGQFLLWLTIGGRKVAMGERCDYFPRDRIKQAVDGYAYVRERAAAQTREGEISARLATVLDKACKALSPDDADLLRLATGHAIANGFLAKVDSEQQAKVPA